MRQIETQHNATAIIFALLCSQLAAGQTLPDSATSEGTWTTPEATFKSEADSAAPAGAAETESASSETIDAGTPAAEAAPAADLNIFGEKPQRNVWLTPEAELEDAQQRFLNYYTEGSYQRAIVAAGQTVELSRSIHGYESLEAGLALGNLATAQTRVGEQAAAITNYTASIYLIEENDGIVSHRLVNPLLGLAATHNATGAYDLGLKSYERALRISHVENGLFNLEQLKIRDGLTESYVGLGDLDDAEFQQEVQSMIVRQEHAGNLELIIPAIYKLAAWYRRTDQPMLEQQQFQFAVNIIRAAKGKTSPDQIEALRGLSSAYARGTEYLVSIRLLKQAYRINEDSPDRDPQLGADILVELGDTYNAFSSQRDAHRTYKRAWELLDELDDTDEQRTAYFGKPTEIWGVNLPGLYPDKKKTAEILEDDPNAFAVGLITLSYDVSPYGRAKNIEIIESDPANLLDGRVKRLVTRFVYRPRMEAGEPIATEKLQLSHSFRYLKGKVQDAEPRTDETERLKRPTRRTES